MTSRAPSPQDPPQEPSDDSELVRRVADLARLELSDAELRSLGGQFRAILAAFRTLDEVDVEGAPEMIRAGGEPRLRTDVPQPSLAPDSVLANAPEREEDFYRVPRTVGEDA